jgi:hypothetical protein
MTIDQMQAEFKRLAAAAIKAGKLTAAERDLICRPHTRKAGYWGNHLRNLREILAERGFEEQPHA